MVQCSKCRALLPTNPGRQKLADQTEANRRQGEARRRKARGQILEALARGGGWSRAGLAKLAGDTRAMRSALQALLDEGHIRAERSEATGCWVYFAAVGSTK